MKPAITDIAGVGPVAADALAEHGINTLTRLARASIERVAAVPGFSEARAARVIAAAAELLEATAGSVPREDETPQPQSGTSQDIQGKKAKKDKDKRKGKSRGKDKKKGKGKVKGKGKSKDKGKSKGKNKGKDKKKGKKGKKGK